MLNLTVALLGVNSALLSGSPMLSEHGHISIYQLSSSHSVSSIVFTSATVSAFASTFSGSLNSTIVLYSTYSSIYTTQIASFSSKSSFTKCVFRNCSATNGAALYCSSTTSIALSSCLFENCIVTGHGGAIFATSTPISLSSCCFRVCYINCAVNDQWGNAIYFISSTFSMNFSRIQSCGTTNLGDSTYFIQGSLTQIFNLNTTDTINCFGPADGLIYSPTSNSSHSYCIIANGICPTGFEWRYCSLLSISHINFVNITSSLGIHYAYGSSATVQYSILVNIRSSPLIYCEGGGSITLVGCISDTSNSLATFSLSPITDTIQNINSQICFLDGWKDTSSFTREIGIAIEAPILAVASLLIAA